MFWARHSHLGRIAKASVLFGCLGFHELLQMRVPSDSLT